MTIVATLLLVAALPILLWPLLRPASDQATAEDIAGTASPDLLQHRLEEVALDLETNRIDRAEAARREAELRREAQARAG